MRYLILIDYRYFRDVSSLEHARLVLKDLRPHARTDVVRGDGLEWHVWHHSKQELIEQPIAWVIKSESEDGYWNNVEGWVPDLCLATRFTEDEVQNLVLSVSRGIDAGWAPATAALVETPA